MDGQCLKPQVGRNIGSQAPISTWASSRTHHTVHVGWHIELVNTRTRSQPKLMSKLPCLADPEEEGQECDVEEDAWRRGDGETGRRGDGETGRRESDCRLRCQHQIRTGTPGSMVTKHNVSQRGQGRTFTCGIARETMVEIKPKSRRPQLCETAE